jgi:SHAQKYF class myb-like DNA-binding protein
MEEKLNYMLDELADEFVEIDDHGNFVIKQLPEGFSDRKESDISVGFDFEDSSPPKFSQENQS